MTQHTFHRKKNSKKQQLKYVIYLNNYSSLGVSNRANFPKNTHKFFVSQKEQNKENKQKKVSLNS